MLNRGKFILSLVPTKDKVRLGQLEMEHPPYETTKGANLSDEDINTLKKVFFGKHAISLTNQFITFS